MGYRSKVVLSMSEEAFNEVIKDKNVRSLVAGSDSLVKLKDEKMVVITFEWIKWYANCEGYEDVTMLEEAAINDLEGSFIRIGEDTDDIECFGYNSSISLSRDVEVTGGEPFSISTE